MVSCIANFQTVFAKNFVLQIIDELINDVAVTFFWLDQAKKTKKFALFGRQRGYGGSKMFDLFPLFFVGDFDEDDL